MMDFFLQLDAWVSSLVFFVLMIIAWGAGLAMRRRLGGGDGDESSRIEDAGLALFGLLLAFCFSGAAGRYENRKNLLRQDAIAIGDFATTASALEGPVQEKLKQELVLYVKQRLVFGKMRLDDDKMPGLLTEGREIQGRMLKLVQSAIAEKNTPSIHAPLMNGYNGLTMAHDNRLYGVQEQVPGSIIFMLVIFGMYTTFTMGRMAKENDKISSAMVRIATYGALVALVYAVTVDLEQPRRGLMRVSQAPMQDLLTSLEK